MAASFTLRNITDSSVDVRIVPDSAYARYRVFVVNDDTGVTIHDTTYNISRTTTKTFSGLDPETNYRVNVGYTNNSGTEPRCDGYCGAQYFTTDEEEVTYYVKLVYNANGGGGAPTSTTHQDTDTSVGCTIPSIEPTRSGYTFLGWSTSSTATSASYQPGTKYNFSSTKTSISNPQSYTLYAVWKQNTYYAKLSYNANGGSGAPNSTTKNSTSQTISFTISSTKPTRSGFTFLGWSTSSSATSATYDPGDSISIRSTSTSSSSPTTVTLYAVWGIVYTVKITYNANGGSGAPSTQTFTGSDSLVEVTLSDTEPTKSGAVFLGWAIISDATDATYYPGDSYFFTGSTGTTSYTLYAVWMQNEYRVSISYVTDHGESYTDYYVDDDSNVPVTMPTLSAEGYIFLGWSTTVPASTATYLPGETYNFTGNVNSYKNYTLYAVWQVIYSLTIQYNANGGSGAPGSETFTDTDEAIAVSISPTMPVREGYIFLGWSFNQAATSSDWAAGGTYYNWEGSPTVAKIYTLYAVWVLETKTGVVNITGKVYRPYIYHNGWGKYIPYTAHNGWKTTKEK